MNLVYSYALGSTLLLIVIASLVVRVVPVHSKHLGLILSYMSALAAGTLLGDAFIYLIPKATSTGWTGATTVAALTGIFIMIITEQMVTWDDVRRHRPRSKRSHAAVSNMVGFSIQSFIDGLVIAAAYLVSIPIGIATTLAVVIHQAPQEISNFVIIKRAGVSNVLANRINVLAVVMSFGGAVIALSLPGLVNDQALNFISPFTAGVFIYVALAQVMPDMLMEKSFQKGTGQIFLLLIGVLLIAGVKYSKHVLGALD